MPGRPARVATRISMMIAAAGKTIDSSALRARYALRAGTASLNASLLFHAGFKRGTPAVGIYGEGREEAGSGM